VLTINRRVVKSYVEGLCWVLEYYFQGTPSWQWYYPYHFSPFASDFLEVGALDIEFTLGAPFRPYEQLMGVFPAASYAIFIFVADCARTDTVSLQSIPSPSALPASHDR